MTVFKLKFKHLIECMNVRSILAFQKYVITVRIYCNVRIRSNLISSETVA